MSLQVKAEKKNQDHVEDPENKCDKPIQEFILLVKEYEWEK